MIAHRIRTILQADHIVVLNHGTVLESGSPKDLLDAVPESSFAALVKASHVDPVEESKEDVMAEPSSENIVDALPTTPPPTTDRDVSSSVMGCWCDAEPILSYPTVEY